MAARLAKITGWSERTITMMPYYKVLIYSHVYNILNGAVTDWASRAVGEKVLTLDEVKNMFDEL